MADDFNANLVTTNHEAPNRKLLVDSPAGKSLADAGYGASDASNLGIRDANSIADQLNTFQLAEPQQPRPRRDTVDTLETHGDVAIELCLDANSLGAKIWDTIRLVFSTCLLCLSIFSIAYAITEEGTEFPDGFPHWSVYIILVACLFCIGVLEGLQIAVVELAHEDPKQYERHYPRAAKLLTWENKGRNVERFLIGRQVLLVYIVFLVGRITTFSVFITDVQQWVINSFMYSGFLGVILVVTVAQLTPQVLASAYPVEFLNLFGMNVAFGICLFVEWSGIAHAVWLLCWTIKNTFYNCLCKYRHLRMMEKRVAEFSRDDETVEMSVKQSERDRHEDRNTLRYDQYDAKVMRELKRWMKQTKVKPEALNVTADGDVDEYPKPGVYGKKCKQVGVEAPCFLLPPQHEDHIPPHVVAMALMKKYMAEHRKK